VYLPAHFSVLLICIYDSVCLILLFFLPVPAAALTEGRISNSDVVSCYCHVLSLVELIIFQQVLTQCLSFKSIDRSVAYKSRSPTNSNRPVDFSTAHTLGMVMVENLSPISYFGNDGPTVECST